MNSFHTPFLKKKAFQKKNCHGSQWVNIAFQMRLLKFAMICDALGIGERS